MTRRRRKRLKALATAALVVAGATASVAIAQTAAGLAGRPAPAPRAEWCTRFASLSLAAAQNIRQGRVEQVANDRMVVVGRRTGAVVKLTLENATDTCRIVRIESL
jgi:hypothetical protein